MSRRIAIVAYPGVQLLDVVGPLEVFAIADRLAQNRSGACVYTTEVVTSTGDAFESSGGLAVMPARSLSSVRGNIDTIVVAGGNGTPAAMVDAALLEWLRNRDLSTRRVASVCSGSFILAAAGLLDGRRATTHWSECHQLARMFPLLRVESDPIYVRDGKYSTSAGITAGMDLALALVEDDLGPEAALEVARWMVMFVQRPGGQSQFSAQLALQPSANEPIRELQRHIAEHPEADLCVAVLATRCEMSERNFARVFAREVGTTPADYVERCRVEVARRLLEQSTLAIDLVATAAGFGSAETLRRGFHRQLGVAPSDYRSRFRSVS